MMVTIAIIRTHNFSAKLIHLGMWLWCIFRGKKPVKTFNHTEVTYDGKTSGAIAEGVKTRNWTDYVKEHFGKKWEVCHYYLSLTDAQFMKGKLYLDEVENTKYEYENFWWHFVKIITGKWKGSKSKGELYCYEHSIRFLNATGKYEVDPFLNPYEFKKWADENLV